MDSTASHPDGLDWILERGLTRDEVAAFASCVPGEFTLPTAYYVNSATPGVTYAGTEEGTLPLVAGRWYLIPETTTRAHADLIRDAAPVARAARLAR